MKIKRECVHFGKLDAAVGICKYDERFNPVNSVKAQIVKFKLNKTI